VSLIWPNTQIRLNRLEPWIATKGLPMPI
ncbi:MAG: hypothetical protein QOJ15_9394, partial [Bradyrhizobium sp.]|jgi:hypothetical protein|nr:hypothetical protein [Bradyrhizobium sp.]